MTDPTHVWRKPPRRLGPIADHDPAWLELLERHATTFTAAIAAVLILTVGVMYATDALAGHLGMSR